MSAPDLDFARDGVCLLPGLVRAADLRALRDELARTFGDTAADGPHGILRHNVWRLLPTFAALLTAGGLARRLRALAGLPGLRLFQDNLVWKTAGASAAIAWHQDYMYWPLDSPAGVTLWVALDDADPASGCLHYLPGTQHEGERAAADFVGGTAPASGALPPVDVTGRESEVVALPARAGDAIAHHPLVWHMSPPNHGPRDRRAWSVSFVAADARWLPAHAPHPFNHELAPRDGEPLAGELFPLVAR